MFMIEISLKLFAVGPKHFCTHWIEVVDTIVTVISLVADSLVIADHVVHFGSHGDQNSGSLDAFGAAAGLLIVFRMWRIVRILNATIVTMSTGISNKIKKMKMKEIYLQRRIFQLERRLTKHHIPLPEELDELDDSDGSHHRLHLHFHRKHPHHLQSEGDSTDNHDPG
ncbi:unnamed protein product [Echinostoma caproni]|uniref:Voltage-gated hydrogen channel 1 n=1 Tax=Echinostoma caproni TaxID=27848 RepID=A0A183APG2_9TREM|nr:unnamed protein product [Echinostoma caproni]